MFSKKPCVSNFIYIFNVFMCYHTAAPSRKQLEKQFSTKKILYDAPEIFHVSGFTRPTLPVTLNSEPDAIIGGRWKLIPFWVKTEEDANRYANTLNAEGESIFEKASYKPYILRNRGLLYVKGFFEPHQRKGAKVSDNFFVYHPAGEIITLGIVWTEFAGYPTFTIVTTAANAQMERIHNVKKRMPLIIGSEKRADWLHASDPVDVKELIKPWDGALKAHQVTRVTAARGEDTNHPRIQDPIQISS